jgi:hypothetical protein
MLLHFADFRASIRVQSVSTLEFHQLHLSLGEFVDTLDVVDGFDRGVGSIKQPNRGGTAGGWSAQRSRAC